MFQITVFHPKYGYDFISVAWTSFIGVLTGLNDEKVSISATNVQMPDPSFHPISDDSSPEKGVPYVFLMRKIMQGTENMIEAAEMLEKEKRTVNLIVGLGDGKVILYFLLENSSRKIFFRKTSSTLLKYPVKL